MHTKHAYFSLLVKSDLLMGGLQEFSYCPVLIKVVVVMLCSNNSKALKQMEAFYDAMTSFTNTVLLGADNVIRLAGVLLQYQL